MATETTVFTFRISNKFEDFKQMVPKNIKISRSEIDLPLFGEPGSGRYFVRNARILGRLP